jgi:biopolymer transport protein TolR
MTNPGMDAIEDLEPVSLNVAINQVLARKEIYPDMQVFVRGDKKVAYEKVIEIIAVLKQYGKIDKVGFMTENPN